MSEGFGYIDFMADGMAQVAEQRLDEQQRRVAQWAPGAGHLVVLGAPGTGKSRAAVELAVRRARALPGERWTTPSGGVMVLLPDRRRADDLGDRLEIALAGTGAAVEVRTPVALAYQLVARSLTARGEPDPTLMSGPDVDAALADLLQGHSAGHGARPSWPESIPVAAREHPAFRAELRDLITRAAELGLGPEQLARHGRSAQRAEWEAAAAVLGEYRQVIELADESLGRGRRLDHARILAESVDVLTFWDQDVGGDVPPPAWSLVVVDDYQDATPAVASLLRVLATGGTQVVLVGDPDTAVQQFRGGRAHLLGEALAPGGEHGFGAAVLRLGTCYRGSPGVRDAVRAVTSAVRPTLAGVAHRGVALGGRDDESADGRDDGSAGVPGGRPEQGPGARLEGASGAQGVEVAVLGGAAQEGAYVARRLREEHLLHGTPWARMAVVVRSAADVARMRAALRVAGVPTLADGADGPLRAEPGVRPLLTAMEAALADRPSVDHVIELLLSPIGGLDAVHVRSAQRELRVRAAGERGVDELLVDAVVGARTAADADPAAATPAFRPGSRHARGVRTVAAVLRATRAALADPHAEAITVLWECWEATGLAEVWRSRALGGGPGAERADADLDAVLALFKEAERYGERSPGGGAPGFLTSIASQDLPQDSLAARARRPGAVAVHTVPGAAGREWDVVLIPGVQEDRWPDLRVRDTLLGTGDLTDLVTGRSPGGERDERGKRREVLDDELRLFASALSRARRLAVVSAVLDEDARPSAFVEMLGGAREIAQLKVDVPAPLDLRGLVAELRRAAEMGAAAELTGTDDATTPGVIARGREAAGLLGRLVAAGVTEAAPHSWVGFDPPSSTAPLVAPEKRVTVSPSAVERATTCGLRWALETGGGRRPSSADQELGNLVHEIAEALPFGTEPELRAELDRRWPELGVDEGTWPGRLDKERAESMITNLGAYFDTLPRPEPGDDEAAARLVRIEEMLDADIGQRAHLRGRTDRLEHTDAGWRVVDLKTGKTVPSKADVTVHPQLAAYQVALRAAGEEVNGARLVYVVKSGAAGLRTQEALVGDAPPDPDAPAPPGPDAPSATPAPPGDAPAPPAPGTVAWAEALVDEAATVMGGATFVARTNATCRTCPVRSACPVQGGVAAEEGNDA